LFNSDHCLFSSPILSPHRQPPIFRSKWSCSQIIDPPISWLHPDKVLTRLYPAKFLSPFADLIALCPGRCLFVSLPRISVMHWCWSFIKLQLESPPLWGGSRPWIHRGSSPMACSPVGDKAAHVYQVSHLSSLVFRVVLLENPSCRMTPPGCRTHWSCVVCKWFRWCRRFSLELHYCCPYSIFLNPTTILMCLVYMLVCCLLNFLDLIMLSSISSLLWTSRLRDKRLTMIEKLSSKISFVIWAWSHICHACKPS
jgi:hypothetical protein